MCVPSLLFNQLFNYLIHLSIEHPRSGSNFFKNEKWLYSVVKTSKVGKLFLAFFIGFNISVCHKLT